MATFQDLMNQATAMPVTPQPTVEASPMSAIQGLTGLKQSEVAAASNAKKASLQRNAAIGSMRDAGQQSAQGLELDLATLSPAQILAKYPEQGMDLLLGQAGASSQARQAASGVRSNTEAIYDTATGVGLGLGNAVGGIGALGLGVINEDAGTAASRVLGEITNSFQESQSQTLRERRTLNQTENQLGYRDSEAQYQADLAQGINPTLGKISREARNAVTAVGNQVSDSVLLGDLTASGAGSLLAAGPVGKVIGAAGKGVSAGAARTGLTTAGSETAAQLAKIGEAIRIPAAIGLMEGGGAYQQTSEEVMKTPFDKLFAESPEFSRLVMEGASPAEARITVANRAGLTSAAIAAPVGAATGALVSRFEGSPFSVPNLRTAGANIMRETVEETIQSGAGQVAQNVGIQTQANQNQDLAAGVGEQAGLGGLGGLTSAGLVQGPRAGGQLATETVDVLGTTALNLGKALVNPLIQRGQRIQAATATASPVADAKVDEAVAAATAQAPVAAEAVKTAVAQAPVSGVDPAVSAFADRVAAGEQMTSPEDVQFYQNNAKDIEKALTEKAAAAPAREEANAYIDELVKSSQYDPEQFSELTAQLPFLGSVLEGSTNKLDVLRRLTAHAAKGGEEGDLSARVAQLVLDGLSATLVKDPEALRNLPDDHPAVEFISQYRSLINDMEQTPTVKRARDAIAKAAESLSAKVQANPFTDQTDISTPEGGASLRAHIAMLELDPSRISPESVDAMLKRAEELGINEVRRKSLMVISEQLKAARDLDAARVAQGLKAEDWVSRGVLTTEDSTTGTKQSVTQYAKGVRSAYNAGNLDEAAARLSDLMQFVEHMSNKIGAVNANVAGRDVNAKGQSFYRTLVSAPEREWRDGTTPIQIHRGSEGSIKFAQRLAAEAEAVGRVANALADAYPELGIGHFDVTPLDSSLVGTPADLAKAYKDSRKLVVEKATVKEPAKPAIIAADGTTKTATVETPAVATSDTEGTDQKPKANETEPSKTVPTEAVVNTSPEVVEEAAQSEGVAPEIAEGAPDNIPSKKGLAAVFPDLVGNTINYFIRGFRPRAEESSRMLRTESPMDMVTEALASEQGLSTLLGSAPSRTLTKDIAAFYQESILATVPDIVSAMNAAARKALNKSPKTGANAGKSMKERILAGEDVLRFPNTKAFNLLEQDDKGNFKYNDALIEAAVLAGMQWFITSASTKNIEDASDAAKQLGIAENSVTQDMLDMLKAGTTNLETLQAIANKIELYWGLQPTKDVGTGLTQGIPMAIATEVLAAMEDAGLVERAEFTFTDLVGSNKEAVSQTRWKTTSKLGKDGVIAGFPNAIDLAMLIKPTPVHFFGEERAPVATHQMRSRYTENTDAQKAAIKANQETPYFKNDTMVSFFLEGLGLDAVLHLLGNGDLNAQKWNDGHRKSVEGQNAAIVDAFHFAEGLMAELQNAADTAGVEADRHSIHYGFNMSKVGRLQMLGAYTPQSNKMLREMIMPTRSTMDLTDPDQLEAFHLAQAQALGIKVHQVSRETMQKQLQALFDGRLRDSVESLTSWLSTGGLLDDATIQGLKDSLGGDMSAVALHALVEEAKLRNATDRSAFETHLYVEADGVTNGPVNSMGLLSMGDFTEDWVKNMAKGGLFIGEPDKTMNQHREFDDGTDLYKATTNTMSETMALGLKGNPVGSPVGDQMRHLFKVMDLFFGKDLSFDEETGVLKLDRGIAKNPLTITVYGSGAKGIAGKMVQNLIEHIYTRMSEALQADDGTTAQRLFPGPNADADMETFATALDALVNKTVRVVRGERVLVDTPVDKRRSYSNVNLEKFQFTSGELDNLATNMLNMFVGPMRDAISLNTGESLNDATTMIRKATQVQSIFLAHEFQRLVNQKLAEKKEANPDFNEAEFLTQAELDEINKQLAPLHPFVETGAQRFYIADSQSVEQKRRVMTEHVNGGMEVRQFVQGPANAGVAGIASLVIGTGDGAMMQNAAQNPSVIRGTLPVFDGINLPLNNIVDASVGMNKAVYDSWQGNPMKGVAEMFSSMLDGLSLAPLNDLDVKKQLVQAIFDRKTDPETLTPEEIIGALQALEHNVQYAARDIDARHAVLSQVSASLDQMASVGAPFQTPGAISLVGSNEQKAEALQQLLVAERAKQPALELKQRTLADLPEVSTPVQEFETEPVVLDEVVAQDEVVQPIPVAADLPAAPVSKNVWNVDVQADFSKFGTADGDVRVGDVKDINKLLRKVKKSSATDAEAQIVGEIIRAKAADGWRLVTGTPEAVLAWFNANGMPVYQPTKEEQASGNLAGFSDAQHKIIAVMNGSLETTIHELVHASVTDSLVAHYEGSAVEPTTKAAIENIEQVMNQFLELNGNPKARLGNAQSRALFEHAAAIINRELALGNKANAMNEFMAWGLANRKLAEIQKNNIFSPLLSFAEKVWTGIRKMVWGRKVAPNKPSTDMLSNLLFNTAVVIRNQAEKGVSYQSAPGIQAQNAMYGNDERLEKIKQGFQQVIVDTVNARFDREVQLTPAMEQQRRSETAALLMDVDLTNEFAAKGLLPTAQERDTFSMIVSALGTEARLNGASLARAHTLYDHVVKNLSVEDLMENPDSQHPADFYHAQEQYNVLMGNFGIGYDPENRSTLLSQFVALSMTSNVLRDALTKMDLPKNADKNWGTLDGALEAIGNTAMESLSARMAGQGDSPNVRGQLDALVGHIIDQTQARNSQFEDYFSKVGGFVDQANVKALQAFEALSKKVVDKADTIINANNNVFVTQTAKLAKIMASITSESIAEKVAIGIQHDVNRSKLWTPLKNLLTDMIGRTSDNAEVYDKIKKVRAYVTQVRQAYVEHVPTTIAKKFTRALTEDEWTTLHNGIAKTDLAALVATGMGTKKVLNLIDDKTARTAEIKSIEADITRIDPDNAKRLKEKTEQLAHFMVTGEAGVNLLRNAQAVGNLFGEKVSRGRGKPSPALIRAVDHLASLYALDAQTDADLKSLSSLVQTEGDGVSFALSYLVGQRAEEQSKTSLSGKAEFNNYKGYIPSKQSEGLTLIVADDRNFKDLSERSFKRIGDYEGSNVDPTKASRGYYFSATPSRGTFNQGILQNVRTTVNGVDAATGFTMGMTAGRITDRQLVAKIARDLGKEKGTENLLPIYNEMGVAVAFERSIDPAQLEQLQFDTHLAKNIGEWRGRQAEEQSGQVYNEYLIEALHKMWATDQQRGTGKDQYVDLFDSKALAKDPVLGDAVSLMTSQTKRSAQALFGKEHFWVRKDMLEDAMGYREASVGDVWTGTSRWSQATQDRVRDLAISTFGNEAYRYLVQAEKVVQNFVKDARVIIVVKSMVVPAANFVSNLYQLASRGVPMGTMVRGFPRKTAEVDAYVKSKLRAIDAEAELRAAEGNAVLTRKLQAEIQSIEDSHRRLSIWPLIEAGEFSSISDAGISRDEILLSEGRLHAYMEKMVSKLPGAAQTVGRYALVTKDTALFQGLQKAVEYGDFLAKAVLYDDLTMRKGLTKEQALGRVTEEFVNYDRLPGRFRGYLEAMGLLWFYNFKIRSTKVALSMIRNNPVHALLVGLAPIPAGVGTPLEDNLFSKGLSGALTESIGIGQGFRALHLNPWANILF